MNFNNLKRLSLAASFAALSLLSISKINAMHDTGDFTGDVSTALAFGGLSDGSDFFNTLASQRERNNDLKQINARLLEQIATSGQEKTQLETRLRELGNTIHATNERQNLTQNQLKTLLSTIWPNQPESKINKLATAMYQLQTNPGFEKYLSGAILANSSENWAKYLIRGACYGVATTIKAANSYVVTPAFKFIWRNRRDVAMFSFMAYLIYTNMILKDQIASMSSGSN